MAKRKTVLSVLKAARQLVARGWCQGNYCQKVDGVLCFCVSGAILKITGHGPVLECQTRDAIAKVIYRGKYVPLANWNDAPRRTQKQVVAAFDRAIKHLEKAS